MLYRSNERAIELEEWETVVSDGVKDDVRTQRTCAGTGNERIRHDYYDPPGYVTTHSVTVSG